MVKYTSIGTTRLTNLMRYSMKQDIEQLFVDNYREYLAMAKRFTDRDEYLAEDIVQEAFARALKYRKSFNNSYGTLEDWFRGILYKAGLDFKSEERMSGMTREVKEWDLSTDVETGKLKKMLQELSSEVALLTGQNKHICHLYFLCGYKPREICEVLNVPNSTVHVSVYRFAEKFRG